MTIKVWFFGTPELSARILQELIHESDISVEFVVTNPDNLYGRHQEKRKSPVKIIAETYLIPIFTPEKIRNNDEFLHEIRSFKVDYFVVVAYGKILPQCILDLPKKMCINVHGSILPQYRGASPIQSSLLHGEKETGVTIMQMTERMDEGDILMIEKVQIAPDETSGTLFEKFAQISGKTLITTLRWIENGTIKSYVQDHKTATYCKKIEKEDGKVDWHLEARSIYHMWQAYTPWPWIYTYMDGKRLLIERMKVSQDTLSVPVWTVVQCSDGAVSVWCGTWSIILERVKLEGKVSQTIANFCNGKKDFVGKVLG